MNYLKPLREFRDRIVHAHAKDARLDQDRLNEVGIMAHPNDFHTPKLPGLGDVDRKSTRLNSSHGYISYAVFCLKKKTRKNIESLKHEDTTRIYIAPAVTLPRSVNIITRLPNTNT